MKVLIVDDDEDVQTFLSNCVETTGCDHIDLAGTGEMALGLSVQHAYDLVTLDVMMPGASGIDIISVVRGMMPWAVIALISGYTEEVTDQAREYADVVLPKPVNVVTIQKLVELTRELMVKRQAIRDLGTETER